MKSRFNIITVATYRIDCILKAVFQFMLSQITMSKSNTSNLVIYLIPIGLWQSKIELEEGRMNFSMLLLKAL